MSGAAEFCYGDAIKAFGERSEDDVATLIESALREGKLVRRLDLRRDAGGLPPASLLGYPASDAGLMAFVQPRREGPAEFLAAWPFADRGIAHCMRVKAYHYDEDSADLCLIEGSVDGVALTVFDTFCSGIDRFVPVGDEISLPLHGWATSLKRASLEPMRLQAHQVHPSVREAFAGSFERDGHVEMLVDDLASALPTLTEASPLLEIFGPVKAVEATAAVMGLDRWILRVTIARPRDDTDLDIEISVTSAVWQGEPPRVGDRVVGRVWLQGGLGSTVVRVPPPSRHPGDAAIQSRSLGPLGRCVVWLRRLLRRTKG